MDVNEENTELVVTWVLPDGSTVEVTHLARDGISILQPSDTNDRSDGCDLSDKVTPTVAETDQAPG